ncbi:hypothetical protein GCM10009737_11260 [Nocardioides lentus]|uniref:DUF2613 family protein n=1 Tax=Nocardioides lentus TaxID=338077 RepID=A0ABP5AGM3_9ACTN
MGTLLGSVGALLASVVVGGAVAAVTVVGLVNSQTDAPDQSPANVERPVVEYGSSS